MFDGGSLLSTPVNNSIIQQQSRTGITDVIGLVLCRVDEGWQWWKSQRPSSQGGSRTLFLGCVTPFGSVLVFRRIRCGKDLLSHGSRPQSFARALVSFAERCGFYVPLVRTLGPRAMKLTHSLATSSRPSCLRELVFVSQTSETSSCAILTSQCQAGSPNRCTALCLTKSNNSAIAQLSKYDLSEGRLVSRVSFYTNLK